MRTTDIAAAAPRWALITGTLLTVAALAACSSAGHGAAPLTPLSSNSGRTAGLTVQLTSAELVVKLKSTSNVTSAHITVSSKVGNQTVLAAQGDETAADGKLTAMSLNEQAGSLDMAIVLTGGALYVKLPSEMNTSGRPWEKADAGSSNPVLRQLASSISSLEQSASLDQYRSMAQAATSLRTVGTEQVNGAAAIHYLLMVDVTKIHGTGFTDAARVALTQAGIAKIPVDVWVDSRSRPVRMSEKFSVNGQLVSTDVTVGQYNQPVTIAAPPASQVSTN
jgi:hypothetical protein